MSSLDPRFFNTSDLEEYFVDKTTGEPLAAGVVTFYSDVNRTQKKSVYQLSDNGMGTFTYSALPNPCILSAVGTFQDAMGNNITPYYFPYQGTPTNTTNIVELYYIVVENSGGTNQFTRVGWPNIPSASDSGSTEFKNYIPNGQFLFHNNNPVTDTNINGLDITYIAQGGWEFRRTTGGTSVITNSFVTINPVGINLQDFPRYAYNSVCSVFDASDSVRDLFIKFPDVNTFSSGETPGQQVYTLFLAGESNDGSNYTFDVYLVRNYGTGGTPTANPDDVSLGQVTFTNNYGYFPIPDIKFLSNNNVTLGTNNNDYVGIALRPAIGTWNVQITDFALMKGNVSPINFPVQTEASMKSEGIAGWMPVPNPDGSDLYLPLTLTPTGMRFDNSSIGEVIGTFNDAPGGNLLLCDGTTLIRSAYSTTLGIPYQRLFDKLYVSSINAPRFGTGVDFVNTLINSGNTAMLVIGTNKLLAVTNPSDAGATGFNFTSPIINAGGATYSYYAYASGVGGSTVNAISSFTGAALARVDVGSSGMTVTDYRQTTGTGCYYAFQLIALSATALGNGSGDGKYFTFSNTTTTYVFWFHTASETVPPGSGTKVRINLSLTMNAIDVANIIACAIAGYQTNTLTVTGQPATAGSYFQFYANAVPYIVWYQINGAGTQPSIPGTTAYIKVTLTGSENAASVASLTQIAMNSYSFALPDLRGVFLRGNDPTENWDFDLAYRFGYINSLPVAQAGSFELDQLVIHNHYAVDGNYTRLFAFNGAGSDVATAGTGNDGAATTAHTGGSENRPVNVSVNWYIRY